MNRYSIAALVTVAALSSGLSSGVPAKESVALAAADIGSGWHNGIAFIKREGLARH